MKSRIDPISASRVAGRRITAKSSERAVGYANPPQATRFKPGKSGNPKGRPKGSLNLATDLAAELGEQITVQDRGRSRQITKQRALIKSLMTKALDGDVRATTAMLALYAKVISEPPEDERRPIDEDELLIIRRFAPRLLKSLTRKGAKT